MKLVRYFGAAIMIVTLIFFVATIQGCGGCFEEDRRIRKLGPGGYVSGSDKYFPVATTVVERKDAVGGDTKVAEPVSSGKVIAIKDEGEKIVCPKGVRYVGATLADEFVEYCLLSGTGANEIKFGPYRTKYLNGNLKSEAVFSRNGKKQGVFKAYYDTGVLKAEGMMKDDLKDGPWKEFWPNGKVRMEGNHIKDLQDGIWKGSLQTGERHFEGVMRENRKNGWWKEWYPSGQLKLDVTYKDDMQDGSWKEWAVNGMLVIDGGYLKGEQHGLWKEYHQDGKIRLDAIFTEGQRGGHWREYSTEGWQLIEGNYSKGKEEGKWIEWFSKEQKSLEGFYKGGKQHGKWKRWYKNGTLVFDSTMQDGNKVGKWIEWHENGQKKLEGQFLSGKQKGSWNFYHENGKLRLTGSFEKGAKTGLWMEYRLDGSMSKTSTYRNDEKHGIETYHDSQGKKISGIEYEKGNVKVGNPQLIVKRTAIRPMANNMVAIDFQIDNRSSVKIAQWKILLELHDKQGRFLHSGYAEGGGLDSESQGQATLEFKDVVAARISGWKPSLAAVDIQLPDGQIFKGVELTYTLVDGDKK